MKKQSRKLLKYPQSAISGNLQQSNSDLAEKLEFERFIQASPAVLYRLQFQADAQTPEFMRQASWPTDMGGSFKLDYISAQVSDVLGESAESLLGYPNWWAERIHLDDRKRVIKGYAKLFSEDQVVHEYRLRHSQGDYIWLEVSARMYRDEDGVPIEIVGAWIDVGERKALELEGNQVEQRMAASEARFRYVFEHTFDGLLVIQEGLVVMANQAAANALGLPVADLIAHHMLEFIYPDDQAMVVSNYQRRMAGEDFPPFQARILPWRSNVEWVELRGNLIDFEGSPADLVVIRNVTGERLSAEKLRASEARLEASAERLHRILDADFDAVLVHQDMRVVFSNKAAQMMFGFTSLEETIGVNPQDFMDPAMKSLAAAVVRKIIRTGRPVRRVEMGAIHPVDGHIFPMEIASAPITWDDGPAVVSVLRDITTRKQQEQFDADQRDIIEKIADSSVPLADVLELIVKAVQRRRPGMKGSILLLDEDGIHLRHGAAPDLPKAYSRVFDGVPIDSAVSSCGTAALRGERMIVADIVHDPLWAGFKDMAISLGLAASWSEPVMDAKGNVLGTFAMYYSEPRSPDVVDLQLLERVAALTENAITHKQAEMAIRQEAERLRMLLNADLDAVVVQQDDKIVYINRQAQIMSGQHDMEAMLGESPYDYVHPKYQRLTEIAARRCLRTGKPTKAIEILGLLYNSRHTIPIEIASAPIIWSGRPAVVTMVRDISERKQAEQALRESAERIESVGRNMTGVVFQFGVKPDGNWYFPFISESVERFFGVSAAAIMQDARLLLDRVHADDIDAFVSAIKAAVADETAFAWQGRFISRNDQLMWFACSSDPQQLEDGNIVWNGVGVNETAQHQLEDQLRQAQKMESVGTMAGGIAHDFNNMLAGMLGQLFLLKSEIADRPESMERIASIEQQGYRAAEIIQQMLTFARKSHVSMCTIQLSSLLKEMLKLHRVALPENIDLQVSLKHEGMIIQGDVAMLQQMVLNLLTNARDAVAEVARPRITLVVEPVASGDGCYRRHEKLAGKALVCLSVRDNGCGVPKAMQASIFDPFFTTKEVGKGTGLGLAMVYGGMQTHGGAVEMSKKTGAGSEFGLYFPRTDKRFLAVTQAGDEVMRGDGKGVLVADDEPVLRKVLDDVLSSIGYRVFLAADGEEAVSVFRQHRHEIDLAILDVVMPKMGGSDACRRIREIDAQLPVLFHTGYGQGALVDDMIRQPLCDSLTKPASIEQLTARMAGLLRLKAR